MGKILDSLVAKGISLDDGQKGFLAELDAALLEAVTKGTESMRAAVEDSLNAKIKTSGDALSEELKAQVLEVAGKLDKLTDKGVKTTMNAVRKALEENKDKLANMKAGGSAQIQFQAPLLAAAIPMTRANTVSGDQHLPVPDVDMVIGRIPRLESSILDDVNVSSTIKDKVAYIDELPVEGGPAFIEEGTLKPSMSFSYETALADVKKVAVLLKVSTEDLDDIDFLESEIRVKMPRELRAAIQKEILLGGTTAADLPGIIPIATAYANAALAGQVATPTIGDVAYALASQIWGLGYVGTVQIRMNPASMALMKLTKDANGNYMSNGNVLEGIEIVSDPLIPVGYALAGQFDRVNVRMRKNITIDIIVGTIKDSNGAVIGTDGEYNFVTFRGEARLAMYIKANDRAAFVYTSIATVQADIEKA